MKKLILLLTSFAFSGIAAAQQTHVYFQNNTSLSFFTRTIQSGNEAIANEKWWASTANISAWQYRTEILWTKRDSGIRHDKVYYLDAQLIHGSDTLTLKLKLRGKVIGSQVWASASGPGWQDEWTNDKEFHSRVFTLNKKSYELKYRFYFTGGYDHILYALQEIDPYQPETVDTNDPAVINVLAYNVFMRPLPLFLDDQAIRSKYIHQAVGGFDAILLQEIFDDSEREVLLNALKADYPYQSDIVDNPDRRNGDIRQDGGVMIVSKWPIVKEGQELWGDNCEAEDCIAYKGIKYVSINKLGTNYHLFSTHMDAFNLPEDIKVRKVQMKQFKDYIDNQNIPKHEAVIMGGDFNIDKHRNKSGEYDSLWTSWFSADEPNYVGIENDSWDTESNSYNLEEEDDPEYLDYVVNRSDYLSPKRSTQEVLILRSVEDEMWEIFDLSDHYGVLSRFEFEEAAENIVQPVHDHASLEEAKITGFTATRNKRKVELEFTVTTQSNINAYRIESSIASAGEMREIGEIAALRDGFQPNNYAITDQKARKEDLTYHLYSIGNSGSAALIGSVSSPSR